MAHFYGTMKGNRGEVTREGTAASGLHTKSATYSGAVEINLWVSRGKDHFKVIQTPHVGCGIEEVIAEGIIGEALKPALPVLPEVEKMLREEIEELANKVDALETELVRSQEALSNLIDAYTLATKPPTPITEGCKVRAKCNKPWWNKGDIFVVTSVAYIAGEQSLSIQPIDPAKDTCWSATSEWMEVVP